MSKSGMEHVLECVYKRTSPEPDGNQNNTSNLWTGRTRMKADGSSSRSPLERDEVSDVVDQLVEQRKVIEWHGLLAPATEEHLQAIVQNEQQSGAPRRTLVGKANRWLQEARKKGGKEVATDGGVSSDETERDHIYVGRTPGMTRWSTDYGQISEWAGGEENVSIMHDRAHIGYVADLSEHPKTIKNQWCSVNHRYECGHFAYGPPRLLPAACPECNPAFAEQLRQMQEEADRDE